MDYIYSYNCLPISQFYSDFKITQNSPHLNNALVSENNFRAIGEVVYLVGVTTNREQFCGITHSNLQIACENIGPNTL